MSCRCGHHRLTHTYTAAANCGPCLSHPRGEEKCDCAEFEEEQ